VEASAVHAPAGLARVRARGPLLRLRTDDQLVALFRMGYDEAFDAIHQRYRQRLLAYTRQMLGAARTDAEDVLQDVFLRAYGALRLDDRPVTLRAWLYRVAHNRCIDHLRRPVPPAAEVYELSRTPARDPSDETQRREDLRRLVADLQRLPEQQRSALLMRELDGLTYAELADALCTTLPAVKSLLVRARIGLVEAGEARDAACSDIRADLSVSQGRGVRASSRARRHLRDCAGCRDYRRDLRGLQPASGPMGHGGPLAAMAKLLGIGGASSGAAAGATAGAGGSVAVAGGAATATATKVVAIVCCAAVVGGGAVEAGQHAAAGPHPRDGAPTHAARTAGPAPAAAVASPPAARAIAAPSIPRLAPGARRHPAAPPSAPAPDTTAAAPEEGATGGALAPEEGALPDGPVGGGQVAPTEVVPAAPAAVPAPAAPEAPADAATAPPGGEQAPPGG
jgi:RNA polymerase sigma factor (sigma-70 family)